MSNAITNIYKTIISFQALLLLFFIVQNFETLDEVAYSITINEVTYDFTVNFYALIGLIATIATVIVLVGLNVFGSGLNETSTATIASYIAFASLIVILQIGLLYYLQWMDSYILIVEVIISLIYFLYFMDQKSGNDQNL